MRISDWSSDVCSSDLARGVRSLRRTHDGDPDSPPSPARGQLMSANPIPSPFPSSLQALNDWVADVAALTRPDRIPWCDGSDAEFDALVAAMQADGTLLPLNHDTHPGSWLHRSDPDDVARVEHLTFVCHEKEADVGPNNPWMAPADEHAKVEEIGRAHVGTPDHKA